VEWRLLVAQNDAGVLANLLPVTAPSRGGGVVTQGCAAGVGTLTTAPEPLLYGPRKWATMGR
jgi:hypothetical protein